MAPSAAKNSAFLHQLRLRSKAGCRHCSAGCLALLKDDTDSILRYRRSFCSLPKDAQDRDLLWVFGGGPDEFLPAPMEHTSPSPSPSSDQAQPMEHTSASGSEGEHVVQPSPTSVAESCDHAREEHTTASENEAAWRQQCASPTEEYTTASENEAATQHQRAPPKEEHTRASDNKAATQEECTTTAFDAEAPQEFTTPSVPLDPLVSEGEDGHVSEMPPQKRPRYTRRRRTGSSRVSVSVQGIFTSEPVHICRKAAEFLIGVGPTRVQRVLYGEVDRRTKGARVPNRAEAVTSGPMSTCLRFLWTKYHFDAEGLPDKFCIQRHDAKTLTIGAKGATPLHSTSASHGLDSAEALEEEERAIAGFALYIANTQEPNAMVCQGPGTNWGPARYIGVMKPIHLYLELEAWCAIQEIPKPSFQTLLRALQRCGCVRFRKTAGQHPSCDACVNFKQRLGAPQSPELRAQVLEEYCHHILLQWYDRGVDSNSTELSRTCRRLLESGARLNTMARQSSFWFVRIDGVDQAKFRVPRRKNKTHDFEKLIRPALHVQGAWCEGFAYHLAVADADMKKDTNNNMEVFARLIEDMYHKYQGLPLAISLIQDNTCRECKNQLIMKLGVKLVALGCLESIAFLYPEKGHTHGPLDGSFGQMCVKLSLAEFDDAQDVVNILDNFLKTSGLDEGTRQNAKAYKLDEAAQWMDWAEANDVKMSALTGPYAPHSFRICRRKHVGQDCATPSDARASEERAAELAACHRADHRGFQPNGEDVVMVVKARMASREVAQVILMVPAADLHRHRRSPPQPQGNHPRRPASDTDRKKVCERALAAFQAGAIGEKARDYLIQWSRGTQRRQARPSQYHFLSHRVQSWGMPNVGELHLPAPNQRFRPVVVQAVGGHGPLPLDAEPDDDADPGPLVISTD